MGRFDVCERCATVAAVAWVYEINGYGLCGGCIDWLGSRCSVCVTADWSMLIDEVAVCAECERYA